MRRLILATTMLASGAAGAITMQFVHPYGELVDRGSVTVDVSPAAAWDCTSTVEVDKPNRRVILNGAAAPAGQTMPCVNRWTATLPELAPGTYEVRATLVGPDATIIETLTKPLVILPIDGRCNADPALSPSIMTLPKEPAAAFVERFNADGALRALLGNPRARLVDYQTFTDEVHFDFPPLDDLPPAMDRLVKTGLFERVERNGHLCGLPPPDSTATFVEFYHAGLDHYFYTGDDDEIAAIDAGKVGPWLRTGQSFRAVTSPGCAGSTTDTVVYRFAGRPGAGPSSHFFTRDRAECYTVEKSRRWDLEGVPMWATPVRGDGTCPAPYAQTRVTLYRVWRPFGESNHRYTTRLDVVAQMVARGWIDEGPAMCVLGST